jgi:hypothetical protein
MMAQFDLSNNSSMKKNFTLDELLAQTNETKNGCLEWSKAKTSAGYSQKWDGEKISYVHRIVCEIVNGVEIGLDVLHSCDNPPCINPKHLSWGTRKENVQDMIRKNRQKLNPQKGEKHGMSKLTKQKVREIRKFRKEGVILRVLSEKYGVSIATVQRVAEYKIWKEVK